MILTRLLNSINVDSQQLTILQVIQKRQNIFLKNVFKNELVRTNKNSSNYECILISLSCKS